MVICGIEFEQPDIEHLKKWDYREWKEARSKFFEIWLDSYQRINEAICRMRYCFVLKNDSILTMDGTRVYEQKDVDSIREIISAIRKIP